MQVGRCWRIFLAQCLTKMLFALPETTEGESGSVFPAKEVALRLWWSRLKGCWMFAWAVQRICNQWLYFLLKLSVSRGREGTPHLLADRFFAFHRNLAFVAKGTKVDTCWCLVAQGWAESNLCLHRQIALFWLGVSLVLEGYIETFTRSEKTDLALAGVQLFWQKPLCRLQQWAALPFLCHFSEAGGEHWIFFQSSNLISTL